MTLLLRSSGYCKSQVIDNIRCTNLHPVLHMFSFLILNLIYYYFFFYFHFVRAKQSTMLSPQIYILFDSCCRLLSKLLLSLYFVTEEATLSPLLGAPTYTFLLLFLYTRSFHPRSAIKIKRKKSTLCARISTLLFSNSCWFAYRTACAVCLPRWIARAFFFNYDEFTAPAFCCYSRARWPYPRRLLFFCLLLISIQRRAAAS